jgi:hypothetical protein
MKHPSKRKVLRHIVHYVGPLKLTRERPDTFPVVEFDVILNYVYRNSAPRKRRAKGLS